MYTTTTIKHKRAEALDALAREAGRCYSRTVSLLRKTHKRKGFWLSKGAVQKYLRLRGFALHSQSVQACVDSYFDALSSYRQAKKSNPDAKPPKRTPRHFKVRWKSGAIRHKDGVLILSNGKGRAPIILKTDVKPKYVEMYFQSFRFSLQSRRASKTGNRYHSFRRYGRNTPDCLSRR